MWKIIISIIVVASFLTCSTMTKKDSAPFYIGNPSLPKIVSEYQGNIFRDGAFVDPDNELRGISFSQILSWRFSSKPQADEKRNDPFKLKVTNAAGVFDSKDDMIVWLGHASFLIRIDGKTILIDPVFESVPFVKRISDAPVKPSDIKKCDYLLVSHGHYDHLDKDTIAGANLNGTRALLPLKMGDELKKMNGALEIEEAGWYQKYTVNDGLEIYLLPARHWSRRSFGDTNEMLWGSYIIKSKKKTIYFAGDSAYGAHYKKIAELFPKIDIALMPIGAYKPDYIMKTNHMSPQEAARASNDLHAKLFIPMHYGTFDLSDEPPGEPLRLIKKASADGELNAELKVMEPGVIWKMAK
jgi:L-ascorbate metabolism protein UlaG (beta-lactamase superfamily)